MNIAGKEKEVTLFSGSYGRCGVQIACLIAKLTNAAKIFNSSPVLNGPHNRITYISISIGIRVGLAGFEAFALLNVLATRQWEWGFHSNVAGPISPRHKSPVYGPW